jgi:hypothetical protein
MKWLLLIVSLPTENATVRMRAWRALKASGAAVLRDGVYLLPATESCRKALELVAADVQTHGGTAYLMESPQDDSFLPLFDRSQEFDALIADIQQLHGQLAADTAEDTIKQARKLRKAFTALIEVDFFPADSQSQARSALEELERLAQRVSSSDEPHATECNIPVLQIKDYQQKLWATRRRPWVDRLASAWLIRRFIDSAATFVWLDSPAACPANAIGFDFDGATFTHVNDKVTFEVLAASFSLNEPAIQRVAALVHYLDVGGVPVNEAAGLQAMLDGLLRSEPDDDRLLEAATTVFDSLFMHFSEAN